MALGALTEAGPALIKQYVTNKLLDKGIAGIEKFTDTSSDEDKDKSGLVSQQKTGGLASILGRALAFSLFGPLLGPLAFAGGKGLLNLGQRRGFLPGGEQQIVDDPRGTFTAEGMQFADVQDTLGSMDSETDIDYNTEILQTNQRVKLQVTYMMKLLLAHHHLHQLMILMIVVVILVQIVEEVHLDRQDREDQMKWDHLDMED